MKTMNCSPRALTALVALAAGSTAALAGGELEFVPIPLLPNAVVGLPAAISADGTTATGLARFSQSGSSVAFRFVRGQGVAQIFSSPSEGTALSGNGKVVVGDAGPEGFLYNDPSPGVLYGAVFTTIADITSNGQTLVGNTTANGVGPFRGDQAGVLTSLGLLANHSDVEVTGVAADGSAVVGTAQRILAGEPSFQAAKKTGDNAWVGLGFLETNFPPGNGNPESYAEGVSPDGARTVGFSKVGDGYGGFTYHAFAHTTGDGMVNLSSLFGQFGVSFATDVANSGTIVGVSDGGSSATGQSAVLWLTGDTQPRDLKDYVLTVDPSLFTAIDGWSLTEAVAISDNGAWIVGRGINPQGQTQGFMVRIAQDDVPNPVCAADFNADGFLNQEDLGGYIVAFTDESIPPGPSGTSIAPCPGAPAPYDTLGYAADYNRDCNFDQEDLVGFITDYFLESENPVNCIPG